MVKKGILRCEQDIFYLTLEEIIALESKTIGTMGYQAIYRKGDIKDGVF